ncbi:hypothetical protein GCM10028792_37870 [Salinisphaera aquimarina]
MQAARVRGVTRVPLNRTKKPVDGAFQAGSKAESSSMTAATESGRVDRRRFGTAQADQQHHGKKDGNAGHQVSV